MPTMNRQITLAARPVGMPKESDFRIVESPLPNPGRGEVLVRTLYLSVDPYMRGRLTGVTTYARGLDLGDVIVGGVAGRVLESKDPRCAPGDIVEGMLGWQEYAAAPAKSLRRIDPAAGPISSALYVLGMPGLTAYFGLLEICHPQPGETVVVSGAAGAVGSLVGQIARIKRCRAIGIAGTNEKVRYLVDELGFESAFNYRETPDCAAQLKELCPNGIDVYFDNVGGTITDAVMQRLASHARVAVCGQISQYNSDGTTDGSTMVEPTRRPPGQGGRFPRHSVRRSLRSRPAPALYLAEGRSPPLSRGYRRWPRKCPPGIHKNARRKKHRQTVSKSRGVTKLLR